MTQHENERKAAISIAAEAATTVRQIYESQAAQTYTKADDSPVTDADLAADRIIRQRLNELYPNDAILTEEGADDTARLTAERCWIVDPIDGTQQFIERTGQFDVLIALVVDGRPVVGVSAQPTTGLIVSASAGGGAWLERLGDSEARPLRLAVSNGLPRLVTTIWFDPVSAAPFLLSVAGSMGVDEIITLPTGAMVRDFLDPATGQLTPGSDEFPNPFPADGMIGLWVRNDGTLASEWDYAAPDLIINEAGGRFTDWRGKLFQYNKSVPRNNGGLIIATSPELHQRLVTAVEPLIEQIGGMRSARG